MSVTAVLIGALVGAFAVNFFFDHWDFADYFLSSIFTAFLGCIIGLGILWVINTSDVDEPAAATATASSRSGMGGEEVRVEKEPPSSEGAPNPQYDFGGDPDFGGQSFKAGKFGGEK